MSTRSERQSLAELLVKSCIIAFVSGHGNGYTRRFNDGYFWGVLSTARIIGIDISRLDDTATEWYNANCPGRFDGCKTGCEECGRFAQSIAREIK